MFLENKQKSKIRFFMENLPYAVISSNDAKLEKRKEMLVKNRQKKSTTYGEK